MRDEKATPSNPAGAGGKLAEEFLEQRRSMVEQQIRERDIGSPRLLEALLAVPRHLFVPGEYAAGAYTDQPLPIGEGQTISQPFMVAAMTDALELTGRERVLEVGTGEGTLGLPEAAPYDAIVVTAAAPRVPPPLAEQLAEGGRLVIPVGQSDQQELWQVRKTAGETTSRVLHYCRFVPLVGRYGWRHQLHG